MNLAFLSVLAEPWFVVPWYAVGAAGAVLVARDMRTRNRQVDRAVMWAWPIIVVFFSVIGIALYLTTSRPPGIGAIEDEREQMTRFHQYSENAFRKVTAAVIHCVGGDGLGVMTAMVLARLLGMSFWQEYWFEYAFGYAFGWFIFQYMAMRMMTDSVVRALWMGGRGEFFSMLTVMGGMGGVMGFVTPLVVGEQPKPYTFAFWGFAALGLLAGAVLTYPMNWLLVEVGWKHGLGMKAKKGLQAMERAA